MIAFDFLCLSTIRSCHDAKDVYDTSTRTSWREFEYFYLAETHDRPVRLMQALFSRVL